MRLIDAHLLLEQLQKATSSADPIRRIGLVQAQRIVMGEPTVEPTNTPTETTNTPTDTPTDTDLISRADAIEAVCGDCTIETKESCESDGYCYEVRNLLALPSADRPHGQWIEHENYNECNLCHALTTNDFNYCPNCGAKMGGDDHETD